MRIFIGLVVTVLVLIATAKVMVWNECREQHSLLYCLWTHAL